MSELQTLYQGCLLEVIPQQSGGYICSCIPPCVCGVYVCQIAFLTIDEAMEEARAKALGISLEISLENSLFND